MFGGTGYDVGGGGIGSGGGGGRGGGGRGDGGQPPSQHGKPPTYGVNKKNNTPPSTPDGNGGGGDDGSNGGLDDDGDPNDLSSDDDIDPSTETLIPVLAKRETQRIEFPEIPEPSQHRAYRELVYGICNDAAGRGDNVALRWFKRADYIRHV